MYGQLISLGMSLHEIRKHNKWEIVLMNKALERYSVIQNGQQLASSPELRKDTTNAKLYQKYIEETQKYMEQVNPDGGDS